MCLTISQPFYSAFICGECLNNVNGKATAPGSCFDIGGSNMTADEPSAQQSFEPRRNTRLPSQPYHPRLGTHAGMSRS